MNFFLNEIRQIGRDVFWRDPPYGRCLKRYFYSELDKHAEGLGDQSIFEKSENGGLFKLREHIKFHLYVNTVTCGDARIFNPNANDEFDDFNDARMNRGILRTKIESGEGTIPIPKDFSVLTWDGVIAGERLLTASCSDKVMRWNILGLQGKNLVYKFTGFQRVGIS